MQRMLDRGVATRRGVMCMHRERPYAGTTGSDALAVSEYAQDRTILLPLFDQMTSAEQDRVVEALRDALEPV